MNQRLKYIRAMALSDRILSWYKTLEINVDLPDTVRVLNPYRDMAPETFAAMESFYHRYYADDKPRKLIMGINPGRLGAGLTGIPFTDTPALRSIGIDMPHVDTSETSAEFVWKVIEAYGGPDAFFAEWFIGGVSPLGFIQLNEKGNWVNFNYYDDPKIQRALTPFLKEQIGLQQQLVGNPDHLVLFGTGKNAKAVNQMNDEEKWFQSITALEHPRFVMQYRRKRSSEFIEKFIQHLARI